MSAEMSLLWIGTAGDINFEKCESRTVMLKAEKFDALLVSQKKSVA